MSTKEFTARTFAFLHAVNADHELPASDLKVALALTKFFNETNDGRGYPSCKTLGEEAGVSEATVIRGVRRLERRGHLRVVWGQPGRGHPNQYWMAAKPAQEQVSEPTKPARGPAENLHPEPENLHQRQIKPAPVQENLSKNHLRNHRREIYSSTADLFGFAPEASESQSEPEPQPKPPPEAPPGFAAFWASYPRRVGKLAARAAFDRVIRRREATAAELVAGARAYAAERAGLEPRFTKHPATWLRAGCWEDEPPPEVGGPPVIDEAGNLVSMRSTSRAPWQAPTWEDMTARLLAGMTTTEATTYGQH